MTTMDRNMSSIDPRWGNENRPRKAEAIWQTLLHHGGPDIAQGRWVDIGCGSGGIAAHLAPRVGAIVGLDPEPWSLWADWMNEHDNLTFLQGSYDSEPALILPGSVDVVICNQVYEHVPDPAALINFIHRILKPHGYCYFAGPNLLFPIEPHVFLPFVHWLPRGFSIWLMRKCGSSSLLDANSTDYWRLRHWLRRFKTINAIPYIINRPEIFDRTGWHWSLLSKMPTILVRLLTPLSPTFVFVLQKQYR